MKRFLMNPIDIINEFYKPGSKSFEILLKHSQAVAGKALCVAEKIPDLNPDTCFIEEAAILHDIGIFYTHAPSIGCYGTYPYVCHGYLGRKLMEDMGFNRHALVCERHVGAGLAIGEIQKYNLPLPERDMIPISIEEQVVCYADKFFSKNQGHFHEALSVEAVVKKIGTYGFDQAQRFKAWVDLFEERQFH